MKRNKVIDETINAVDIFYKNGTELNIIGALLLIGCALVLLDEQLNTVMSLIKVQNYRSKNEISK